MKTLYLCLITFFSLLAIDAIATEKPEPDVLDLLKQEKVMARAEHNACASAIKESQQATAQTVEATVKAVEEAEIKVELAMKEMTLMKVQLDSVATVTVEDSWMYQGPLYDEWKQYRDTGGTSDFEYYRLYKK
jgi:preprotein translocase subunit YajC